MSTKNYILKKLEENRDRYISGEEMANELNLSRTAIWKGINNLKKEGFEIKSSTNKGYKLSEDSDKISEYGISHKLIDELSNIDIEVYDTIDSTNTQAKRNLYEKDTSNFTIIVSEEQTKGRGRRGRNFQSPKATGIYLSVIVIPKNGFNLELDLITVKAAVAVALSIEEKANKKVDIKWVNDIFLNHKKICGILSEADFDFESKEIKSIIIGIGINFSTKTEDFKKELQPIAGSLFPKNLLRNDLIAEIINNLYKTLYKMTDKETLKIYKEKSLLLGREVTFTRGEKTYNATAIDVDEKANLIVDVNGEKMKLSSGEVSIKGKF